MASKTEVKDQAPILLRCVLSLENACSFLAWQTKHSIGERED